MLALYQFQSCPFCSKVRAFLNHTGTPYEIIEVSPFGMKELQDFTDHKKVPVLRDGDQVVVESAAIVEHLSENCVSMPQSAGAEQWLQWVDDTLVHNLPPLVHPNFTTSYRNFARVMGRERVRGIKGFVTRLGGALIMPRVARKMQARHNIQDASQAFSVAIDYWVSEGLRGKTFFGGEQPDRVDTSVFGVLHSVHGLNILEPEQQRNPTFADWYQRCAATMAGSRAN